MSQLTDKQIEAAARVCYNAMMASQVRPGSPASQYDDPWKVLSPWHKPHYRNGIVAVAPFLQLPWSQPTYEEMKDSCELFARDETLNTIRGVSTTAMYTVLGLFVHNRNAALIPKAVDPRREKILRAIDIRDTPSAQQLADRILAALDAKE